MLWHLSSECQVSQITYKKVVTHLLQISADPKCGVLDVAIPDKTRRARVTPALMYPSLRAPALMATPMVVTGLWFSRPFDRVETFRGSA